MTHEQPGGLPPEPQMQQDSGMAYGLAQPLVMAQFLGQPLPQLQQAGCLLEHRDRAPE